MYYSDNSERHGHNYRPDRAWSSKSSELQSDTTNSKAPYIFINEAGVWYPKWTGSNAPM